MKLYAKYVSRSPRYLSLVRPAYEDDSGGVWKTLMPLCVLTRDVSQEQQECNSHVPVRQSQIAAMHKSQSGSRLPGHSLGIADSGSSSGDLEKE